MREPFRKPVKTFTLRLTELEAEALERVAFIENEVRPGGQSKNKLIVEWIAKEYAKYEEHAVINNRIRSIAPPDAFAAALVHRVEFYDQYDEEELLPVLAAIEYAAKHINDDGQYNIDEIEEILQSLNEEAEYLIKRLESVGVDTSEIKQFHVPITPEAGEILQKFIEETGNKYTRDEAAQILIEMAAKEGFGK